MSGYLGDYLDAVERERQVASQRVYAQMVNKIGQRRRAVFYTEAREEEFIAKHTTAMVDLLLCLSVLP